MSLGTFVETDNTEMVMDQFEVFKTDKGPNPMLKYKIVDESSITGKEYQELAMRTNDGKASPRLVHQLSSNLKIDNNIDIGEVIDACLGLSGEVGEFNDMIKKWIFHEKPLDIEHLKKECGDIMWYIALMCHSFGWDLDEIMQMNIDKLKARYPEGFDIDKANNRKEGDV